MKTIITLLAALMLGYLPFSGIAAEITSAGSGSWSTPATWNGGVVPGSSDHVTIQSGHVVTVSVGTKACASLTVESGGKLFSGASSGNPRYIDIFGNITCNGTIGNGEIYDVLSFSAEGDSCVISGTGSFGVARIKKAQSVASSTLLIFEMSASLRYGGTALYNEKSGTTLHVVIGTQDTLFITGNGVVGGNLSIDGTAANGGLLGGSVTVNGTLVVSGRLYLYTNNSGSTYPVSFTISPGGSVIADSVIASASGVAGHTLTISNGASLVFTGGGWIGMSTVNNSYFLDILSTVEYSGDIPLTVPDAIPYGNLVISGTAARLVEGNVLVNNTLTIQNGSILKVLPGKSLTVQGSTYLGSGEALQMLSPSDTGATGSFIFNGSLAGSGSVKFERFLTPYADPADLKYHMLASPVSGQSIQPGFVADPPDPLADFYRWEESSGTWVNSKTTSGQWNTSFQPGDDRNFHMGTGYLAAYPDSLVKTFSGTPVNTDQTIPVSFNPGTDGGFNLIGNPFSSAINGDIQNWSKLNVDNAVWVWDGSTGNYKTWNGTVGSLNDGIIPCMQGFFIHANGPSPALTIPSVSRIHHPQTYYKSLNDPLLAISIMGESGFDETFIGLGDSLQRGIDPAFDVRRLHGDRKSPGIWTKEASQELSINGLPLKFNEISIPLIIQAGTSGMFELMLRGGSSFPAEIQVKVEDRQTGVILSPGREEKIQLHLEDSVYGERFVVRLIHSGNAGTEYPLQHVHLFSHDNYIQIKGLPDDSDPVSFSLYGMSGELLRSGLISGDEFMFRIDHPTGVYVAVLNCKNQVLTRKIFIHHD